MATFLFITLIIATLWLIYDIAIKYKFEFGPIGVGIQFPKGFRKS